MAAGMTPLVQARGPGEALRRRPGGGARCCAVSISTIARGRARRDRRRVGGRQEHAAAPPRRARLADRRQPARSTASTSSRSPRPSWRASATGRSASSSSSITCCRDFTALENVMMPALIARRAAREPRGRAPRELLERVGLGDRGSSTGPASCRAASSSASPSRAPSMRRPRLLLADEPTGQPRPGHRRARARAAARAERASAASTLVVVTHNDRLAAAMERTLRLTAGRIEPAAVRRGAAPGGAA